MRIYLLILALLVVAGGAIVSGRPMAGPFQKVVMSTGELSAAMRHPVFEPVE